jgi:flagella basal body P-ring formation protein FlgA
MLLMPSLVLAAAASSREPTRWLEKAESVLRDELRVHYPGVQEWDTHLLIQDRELQKFSQAQFLAAKISRIGARSSVRVQLLQPSGYRTEVSLWYAVSGSARVLVMARVIAPAEPLIAADARIASEDELKLGCVPVRSTAQLAGMRSKVRLHEGQAVCVNEIEPRPAVARGDRVRVSYVGSRIQLTTTGIAQRDGAIGTRMSIRSSQSTETFIATVSGNAEVAIRE